MVSTIAELKERADIPVVTANQDGFIETINESFTQHYGWTADDAVGRPLTLIIPPAMHDAHHLGFSRFLRTETPSILNQSLNLRVVTKGGIEKTAALYIVAEKRNGRWSFAASIRPVEKPSSDSGGG